MVEKTTEDDHQENGKMKSEDGRSLQCIQSPLQEPVQPLQSPSAADQHNKEKSGEPDLMKVTTNGPKMPLTISLIDCQMKPKSQTENEKNMPNEGEASLCINHHVDGTEAAACKEQLCPENSPDHKMETKQEMDDDSQKPKEAEIGEPAKKKRRMGMCCLTEKEQSQFKSPKCTNRPEKKNDKNTVDIVTEEGNPTLVLLSHPQATEAMKQRDMKTESSQSNENDSEETKELATATDENTMVCDVQITEINVSDKKRELDTEVISKHHLQEETECHQQQSSIAEPGCLAVSADGTLTLVESDLHLCECENLKDPNSDQSLHLCEEKEGDYSRAEAEGQTMCEKHKVPDLYQHKQPQRDNSDAEQLLGRSEIEVTADLSCNPDAVCEPQESQTKKAQIDGPPDADQSAIPHSNTDKIEHHVENTSVDLSLGNPFDNNQNESTPAANKAILLQQDSHNTTVEEGDQAVGQNDAIKQALSSDTEMCNGHVTHKGPEMNLGYGPKELHDADISTLSMGPPRPVVYKVCSDQPGLGGLDDVTDSQLNTIVMTEEVMNVEKGASAVDYEDGTELIRGLIRELSSLNRTVMATHREIENLRRRGKNLRNAIR